MNPHDSTVNTNNYRNTVLFFVYIYIYEFVHTFFISESRIYTILGGDFQKSYIYENLKKSKPQIAHFLKGKYKKQLK